MLHLLTLFLILVSQNEITIEADVAMSPSLPAYGVLCTDTDVMNAPEGMKVLYSVSVGTTVQLREQPRFAHRDWVMIKPAEWIPLAALCKE